MKETAEKKKAESEKAALNKKAELEKAKIRLIIKKKIK